MGVRPSRTSGNGHRRWVLMATLAALTAFTMVAAGAAPAAGAGYPNPGPVSGDTRSHDPSMMRTANGTYYLYSTHDLIQMRTSTDRVHFSRSGSAFTSALTWSSTYGTTTDLWAPDVSYHNGKYWMYYAVSSFGSNNSAIGVATSPSGAPGSWADQGKVYSSSSASDYNAIDPSLLVDSAGAWWLSFGSFFSGIKLISLNSATGKQSAGNTTRYTLAQRPSPDAEEAPYIRQANGWYYLFVSWDHCCQGTTSDYRVMVGRSKAVTGPYVDASGKTLTSGGGTQVMASHDAVHGPGGQSVLHDTDGDLLIYHWYDSATTSSSCGCELGVNLVGYDANSWPYVH